MGWVENMKWQHPLKGMKISEALRCALEEDPTIAKAREKSYGGGRFIQISSNTGLLREGICSWTAEWIGVQAHSWDTMRDCVKYGFTMSEVYSNLFEVCAKDNDWAKRLSSSFTEEK